MPCVAESSVLVVIWWQHCHWDVKWDIEKFCHLCNHITCIRLSAFQEITKRICFLAVHLVSYLKSSFTYLCSIRNTSKILCRMYVGPIQCSVIWCSARGFELLSCCYSLAMLCIFNVLLLLRFIPFFFLWWLSVWPVMFMWIICDQSCHWSLTVAFPVVRLKGYRCLTSKWSHW